MRFFVSVPKYSVTLIVVSHGAIVNVNDDNNGC